MLVRVALVGVAERASRPGNSAASEEITALPADQVRGARPVPPAGGGINITITQVTAIAAADIVSARSEARHPMVIPISAKNAASPAANPTHGPRASVRAIPNTSMVKGMTQQIVQAGETEALLDLSAKAEEPYLTGCAILGCA